MHFDIGFAHARVHGSGVLVKVTFTDDTGKVVTHPEFFQRTSAGAGMIMGIADNIMLVRIANLMSRYVTTNFEHAPGASVQMKAKVEGSIPQPMVAGPFAVVVFVCSTPLRAVPLFTDHGITVAWSNGLALVNNACQKKPLWNAITSNKM